MKRLKKIFTVVFGDVFDDPDMVGQSEYRAIYDTVVDVAFNGNVPDDDRVLTKDEREHIHWILKEFQSQCIWTDKLLRGYNGRRVNGSV